jgi:hypothetical protein
VTPRRRRAPPDRVALARRRRRAQRLSAGVASPQVAIKQECLDNLTDLLRRFGHEIEADHAQLIDVTLAQLADDKPPVRKRAIGCIAALSLVLSDAQLNQLCEVRSAVRALGPSEASRRLSSRPRSGEEERRVAVWRRHGGWCLVAWRVRCACRVPVALPPLGRWEGDHGRLRCALWRLYGGCLVARRVQGG